MSVVTSTGSLCRPEIISAESDPNDDCESYYRVQFGDRIKYLVLAPNTIDPDWLCLPLGCLPPLPYDQDWTTAHISRDRTNGEFQVSLSDRKLDGVKNTWHSNIVNCLELERIERLTCATFEATCCTTLPSIPPPPATVIAKIARFEWEIPRIEIETRIYQLLEGTGLAPGFLGHIHEDGRVIGLLLKKTEGRFASIDDMDRCHTALQRLHKLGLRHGDINRHNFLVDADRVTLIDFEHTQENADEDSLREELEGLAAELMDDSGRGAGFQICIEDE